MYNSSVKEMKGREDEDEQTTFTDSGVESVIEQFLGVSGDSEGWKEILETVAQYSLCLGRTVQKNQILDYSPIYSKIGFRMANFLYKKLDFYCFQK